MSGPLYGTYAYEVSPALPIVSTKATGSTLAYLFDFTQEFALPTGISPGGGSPGDSLTGIISLSASPTGLTLASAAIALSGNAVSFWAAGGIAGIAYVVSLVAGTASGQVYAVSGVLPVGFT